MKNIFTLFILICITGTKLVAQIAVNTDGTPANPSAMLDVKSGNKGVLIPRVSTAQRNAIVNPAAGLFVFDSTERTLYMFDGTQWLGFAAMNDQLRPASNFITSPDKQDTTLAGYSVSMWDQFAAIGAPYIKTGGGSANYTGAVYIYHFDGTTWQYFTTLAPTGNDYGALFGQSVCLKGNYLVVGASGQQDPSLVPVGAAYVYYYNGSAWTPVVTIFGSSSGTGFGSVVAINQFGTYVAVSAPQAMVSSLSEAGAVNIYYKPGASFVFQQTISDASPVAYEDFGSAMAMNPGGNNIIVGAAAKTVSGHTGDGFAGQFDRSGTTWTQTHNYTPIPDDNLGIGAQVDIDDAHVIFTVSKTKTVDYLTLGWSGFDMPLTDNVNSIALDPTTSFAYIFAGNSIYENNGGSDLTKLKSLSLSSTQFFDPLLIGAYNKNYVVGIPTSVIPSHPYTGAYYFGTGQ